MRIVSADFRVPERAKIDLARRPTMVPPYYASPRNYKKLLEHRVDELKDLQEAHYASDRHSLLLIFQAMDAAGKDGAIEHVMSGVNPQGCQVFSFKAPSAMELDHDFLWRTSLCLPERGRIGIFNRSYYEEVLVVRVHPEYLRNQNLPDGLADDKTIWKGRFSSIVDHEDHLHRNGTRIIKFFLHVSKEEQKRRLIERIDDPKKNWKVRAGDVVERGFWNEYMAAYQDCINSTSTKRAPWYIVPADDKRNCRLIVSQIVLDTYRKLRVEMPPVSVTRQKELNRLRRQLMKS
jgi:PPK2 family polyphosphate:nucleotide phosphotransferase